jgi:DinB family protein
MDLQYPIGKHQWGGEITDEQRAQFIAQLEQAPAQLRQAVTGLTEEQVDTPYRPEGWTVRQVVHHLPDSHMNTYIRFRLALTEDEPTIKPYDQERWAALEDARRGPVGLSLALFGSLHSRWVLLLRSLRTQDFARTFRHPEMGVLTLEKYLSLVAWHGRHHIAHITSLRERMGWR